MTPGLRLEIDRFSAQAQLGVTLSSPGDPTAAGIGKLGWSFSDALSTWLGAAYGSEALTALAGTSFVTTFATVTAFFGGASYAIDDTWALRLDLTYLLRKDTFKEASASLGVTCKF